MRLRDGLWGWAFLLIGLAGCDDFKTHPAQTATTSSASNAQVASVAPQVATPPPAAQIQPAPADQVLAHPPPPTVGAPTPGSASAQGKAIDDASFADRVTLAQERLLLIKAQVILDRAHFSPGVVDGRNGTNFSRALAAFEAARNAPATAPGSASPSASAPTALLDAAAWQALTASDSAPVTRDYVITAADVKGPFLQTIPPTMADQAKLPHLGYTTPVQALAEKFHMGQALLVALNPGVDFGLAGTSIVVVRPGDGPILGVARVEVDKGANQVRAFDTAGKLVAMFPATVGSTERPAPSGQFAVRFVVPNPSYTYDPSRLTFGNAAGGKLTLQPGPNNPVGSTWIDISVKTYGIHGAPDPTQIGKTASHGCVRLTNWDAAALGKAVKKGTPVLFVGDAQRRTKA